MPLSEAPAPRETPLEVVPLTTYPGREAEPTFSPDGSQVAFTWDGENQDNLDIYVKAIGSEQPLRLTSDPARDGSPAWSPDGTRSRFSVTKPGGGSEVRLVPPTGGRERRLGGGAGPLAKQGLAWSPDGRKLAVVDRSSPGEPFGLFLLDTESGVKERLTSPSSWLVRRQPAGFLSGRQNRRLQADPRQLRSLMFTSFRRPEVSPGSSCPPS